MNRTNFLRKYKKHVLRTVYSAKLHKRQKRRQYNLTVIYYNTSWRGQAPEHRAECATAITSFPTDQRTGFISSIIRVTIFFSCQFIAALRYIIETYYFIFFSEMYVMHIYL